MGMFIVSIIVLVILYLFVLKPFLEGLKGEPEQYKEFSVKIVEDNEDVQREEQAPRTTQVSADLGPSLYKKLDGYCAYKGVSKVSVIKEALTMFFESKEDVK